MQVLYILSLLLALWIWRDAVPFPRQSDTVVDMLARLQVFIDQSAHDSRLCG